MRDAPSPTRGTIEHCIAKAYVRLLGREGGRIAQHTADPALPAYWVDVGLDGEQVAVWM